MWQRTRRVARTVAGNPCTMPTAAAPGLRQSMPLVADCGPMKRSTTWWLAGGFGGLLALAAALPLLLLSGAPSTAPLDDPRHGDVARVLDIARAHDPRKAPLGVTSALAVSERDLDLLLNHAAHRWLGARVNVNLEPGVGWVRVSGQLPGLSALPFEPWLNVTTQWRQTGGLPELEALRVGRLPIAPWLAAPGLRLLAEHFVAGHDLALVDEVVHRVNFGHDQLTVVYAWQADTSARVLNALTPAGEQQRLRAYSDRLVALTTARSGSTGSMTLPELIAPLFELARQRSLHGDAAQENRAAMLTLALFVTGQNLSAVVPAARQWPQPHRLNVTLQGRDDFPQHFLVSAVLALESTGPLANAIGLYKEVADSRGGSGFSFNDIAANRAGARFGELALRDPSRLQALLVGGVDERSLMPDVTGLPEFLTQDEFNRQFGGVGAAGYNLMMADVERRVQSLAFYR